MADLDAIADTLRRNRKDIDDELDKTAARRSDAAALVEKIDELRQRSERVQRVTLTRPGNSNPKRNT